MIDEWHVDIQVILGRVAAAQIFEILFSRSTESINAPLMVRGAEHSSPVTNNPRRGDTFDCNELSRRKWDKFDSTHFVSCKFIAAIPSPWHAFSKMRIAQGLILTFCNNGQNARFANDFFYR